MVGMIGSNFLIAQNSTLGNRLESAFQKWLFTGDEPFHKFATQERKLNSGSGNSNSTGVLLCAFFMLFCYIKSAVTIARLLLAGHQPLRPVGVKSWMDNQAPQGGNQR